MQNLTQVVARSGEYLLNPRVGVVLRGCCFQLRSSIGESVYVEASVVRRVFMNKSKLKYGAVVQIGAHRTRVVSGTEDHRRLCHIAEGAYWLACCAGCQSPRCKRTAAHLRLSVKGARTVRDLEKWVESCHEFAVIHAPGGRGCPPDPILKVRSPTCAVSRLWTDAPPVPVSPMLEAARLECVSPYSALMHAA